MTIIPEEDDDPDRTTLVKDGDLASPLMASQKSRDARVSAEHSKESQLLSNIKNEA